MSKAVRRCGGRLVTGPDSGAFVASCVFLIVPTALAVAFDLRFFVLRLPVALGALLSLGYVSIALSVLAALLRTTYTDPGILPARPGAVPEPSTGADEGSSVDGEADQMLPAAAAASPGETPVSWVMVRGVRVPTKWCQSCCIQRPPRASHCPDCNHCVEAFDHHVRRAGVCDECSQWCIDSVREGGNGVLGGSLAPRSLGRDVCRATQLPLLCALRDTGARALLHVVGAVCQSPGGSICGLLGGLPVRFHARRIAHQLGVRHSGGCVRTVGRRHGVLPLAACVHQSHHARGFQSPAPPARRRARSRTQSIPRRRLRRLLRPHVWTDARYDRHAGRGTVTCAHVRACWRPPLRLC